MRLSGAGRERRLLAICAWEPRRLCRACPGVGRGEGRQIPGRAVQPERRGETALPDGPAIKGRNTPARLPPRFPAPGKCTSHLGFGLGNLITAAYWKMRADRSGSLETMAVTSRLVVLSDCFFTGPGLAVLMATGILIVSQTGWRRFQEPCLGASFMMLVITAIIWLAVLIPLERKMLQLAREGVSRGVVDPAYRRTSRLWAIFGGVATLLPMIILFLMVIRP